jgi:cephalosporin-C deacetylase-like acetyl esterase
MEANLYELIKGEMVLLTALSSILCTISARFIVYKKRTIANLNNIYAISCVHDLLILFAVEGELIFVCMIICIRSQSYVC